jgi:hypothetical protein
MYRFVLLCCSERVGAVAMPLGWGYYFACIERVNLQRTRYSCTIKIGPQLGLLSNFTL